MHLLFGGFGTYVYSLDADPELAVFSCAFEYTIGYITDISDISRIYHRYIIK